MIKLVNKKKFLKIKLKEKMCLARRKQRRIEQ